MVSWDDKRYSNEGKHSKEIQLNLKDLFTNNNEGIHNEEAMLYLKYLETRKMKVLLDKEKDWRMKSKAT